MSAVVTAESCAALAGHKARFLEALRVSGAAVATIKGRERLLRVFFAFLDGAGVSDVRAVTKAHVGDWLSSLASRSPWTRLTYLTGVRSFFAFLEKTDALLVNPCAGFVLRGEDRMPRNIMTAAQVRAVLGSPDVRTPRGRRDRAILEVVYSGGLRRAELARLSVYDLDLAQGYVRVNWGKGNKDRVVPLGRSACDSVKHYLQETRAEWVRDNPQTALWLDAHRPHRPLSVEYLGELLTGLARASGVRASAHVWRHTCATQLVKNGAALPFVQRLLGHASLETTQIYTQVAPKEVQAMHRRAHPRATRAGRPELRAAPVPPL